MDFIRLGRIYLRDAPPGEYHAGGQPLRHAYWRDTSPYTVGGLE